MEPESTRPPADVAGALRRPTEALDDGFVAPPEEAGGTAANAVERLAIRIGNLHLLCAPDIGREVMLPPPSSPLPHTPAWLLGLANVRGALVPVVDLALAFGIERNNDRRAYLLISGIGEDAIGLLVDGLPVLQRLESTDRLANIPPHPAMLDRHLHGAYRHGGAVWLDVELHGFFTMLGEQIGRPPSAG